MAFLRRNQDRVRTVLLYGAALIAIKVFVNVVLGDTADNPVPPDLLIIMAILFAPLVLIAIVGVVWLVGQHKTDIGAVTFSAAADDAWPAQRPVMRPSQLDTDRAELEAAGFEQIGSITAVFPDHTAVFGVCLGPDRSTIAIKSPLHLEIISDFDGKLLTTSDAPIDQVMGHQLSQSARGASVAGQLAAHQETVGLAAEQAGAPTRFTASTALAAVEDWERYALANAPSSSPTKRVLKSLMFPGFDESDRPAITDNAASKARIAHWIAQPERWEPTPA